MSGKVLPEFRAKNETNTGYYGSFRMQIAPMMDWTVSIEIVEENRNGSSLVAVGYPASMFDASQLMRISDTIRR